MACDPDFSDVVLLLHCDGTNGSTLFPDSSNAANTVTAINTTVSTAAPMFGTGAALFTGSSSELTAPVVSAGPLDPGSSDFTYEGWFYLNAYGGGGGGAFFGTLMDFTFGGTAGFRIYVNGFGPVTLQAQFFAPIAGLSVILSNPTTVALGTWHHFALTRQGQLFSVWLDGATGSSATFTAVGATTLGTFSGTAYFGASYNSSVQNTWLDGQLDEIRITIGLARYTAPFTPPTSAFGGACFSGVVPNVIGDLLATGESTVTTDGYTVGTISYGYSNTITAGDIMGQAPSGGVTYGAGLPVDLQVSLGPSPTVKAYGKFVGIGFVSKAYAEINMGDIEPKIWRPIEIQTTRSRS